MESRLEIMAKKVVSEYEDYRVGEGCALTARESYTFKKYFGEETHETLNCILLIKKNWNNEGLGQDDEDYNTPTYYLSGNYDYEAGEDPLKNWQDYEEDISDDVQWNGENRLSEAEADQKAIKAFNEKVNETDGHFYSEGYLVDWDSFPDEALPENFDEIYKSVGFHLQRELDELVNRLDEGLEDENEGMTRSEMIIELANIEEFGEQLDTFQLNVAIESLTTKYFVTEKCAS